MAEIVDYVFDSIETTIVEQQDLDQFISNNNVIDYHVYQSNEEEEDIENEGTESLYVDE